MSNWAIDMLDDFKVEPSVISEPWKPELDYDEIFEKMIERYNMKPIIHHNCHACGGGNIGIKRRPAYFCMSLL